MFFFCSKCRLNFKDKPIDDLCSDCKLTDAEKYLLFKQCIECIEWYDDPYHICKHVKPKRIYRKKKGQKDTKTFSYATRNRKLEKPKEEYQPKLTLIVPIGFA